MKLSILYMDIDELLQDESFCQWINQGCGANEYWGKLYRSDKELQIVINKAKMIIAAASIESNELKDLSNVWNHIDKSL